MDMRVGPPRHLQWKSDPLWCRSHNGVAKSIDLVLLAEGRLFSVIDEGLIGQPGLPDRWTLVVRDGFNGTLLWKQRLARPSKRSLVAAGEKLYLISMNRELTISRWGDRPDATDLSGHHKCGRTCVRRGHRRCSSGRHTQ
jgi:hypothetical protein